MDDMFLPIRQDQLKAKVSDLLKRLDQAQEDKERLRREIMEEEIAYVAASAFSQDIKDTTRYKASNEKDLQSQIVNQLLETAATRCVQEVIGYYRLAGRTTFKFQTYNGIRLETFYRGTYHEPYYILSQLDEHNRDIIKKHTIPNFIPLEQISDAFFPHDLDTFMRILHDFLLAYVSRREQLNELKQLSECSPDLLAVKTKKSSCGSITFSVQVPSQDSQIDIELIYDNLASELPTKVNITEPSYTQNFDYQQQLFLENKLLEAYKLAF